MKGAFIKTENGLVPSGLESDKIWSRMNVGERCMVDFTRGRNYENHKRFFAFANETFEIQDCFDNFEIWRKHLLMIAGEYDEVVLPAIPAKVVKVLQNLSYLAHQFPVAKKKIEYVIDVLESISTIQYWPRSMSFEEMDEEQFKDMFKRSITGFLNRYGNGMTEEELMKIIGYD